MVPPTEPRRYGKRKLPDARGKFVAVRCNDAEYATLTLAAARSGLSVGAFLRAVALGSTGLRAVRRAPAGREELARLLGELGKLGSNANQIARAFNTTGDLPPAHDLAAMRADIAAMRGAVMKALGRGD